jgi:hypothetical protein
VVGTAGSLAAAWLCGCLCQAHFAQWQVPLWSWKCVLLGGLIAGVVRVQLLMLQLSIAAAGIAPIVTLWLRCFSRLHKHSPQNTQIRAGVELLHLHLHVASALLADTARQGLPLVASLLAAYSSGWQHHSPGLSCCVWHVLSPRKTNCGLCIVDYVTPLHRHDQGQRADCQIDDSLRVRLSCQLRAEPAACGTVCVYHTGCVTLTTR